ncbi:UPF0149 family protein [Pseudomonas sp. nanlin1]|uniref:UPF0149 family protein n=1 Tax=Pseudomonas sp. nanlin1 TaxID=3040605 RepID=UPI00388FF82F
MSSKPLSEDEINYLEEVLDKYSSEASVLSVSELDGFFTALVSGPQAVQFDDWYGLLWGAPECLPVWKDEQEFERFFTLIIQHMNNIATHLLQTPEKFAPLFNQMQFKGETVLTLDDCCFGYRRGMGARQGCRRSFTDNRV